MSRVMNRSEVPRAITSSRIRSSTWACTVTSRPLVASSEMMNFGEHARAIAMTTRCAMPPDNSCGQALIRRSGAGMLTWRRSSITRSRICLGPIPMCALSTLPICWPTVWRGSSSPRGLEIIIAMSRPRIWRSSSGASARRSWPANSIRPRSIRPGSGISCIMLRASIVLPDPDSPTRPITSPLRTVRSMSRKAATLFAPKRGKATVRPRISSNGAACTASPGLSSRRCGAVINASSDRWRSR